MKEAVHTEAEDMKPEERRRNKTRRGTESWSGDEGGQKKRRQEIENKFMCQIVKSSQVKGYREEK